MVICLTSVTLRVSGRSLGFEQLQSSLLRTQWLHLTTHTHRCRGQLFLSGCQRHRHLLYLLFTQTFSPPCPASFYIIFIIFFTWSSVVYLSKWQKEPSKLSQCCNIKELTLYFLFFIFLLSFHFCYSFYVSSISVLRSHLHSLFLIISFSLFRICIHLVPCSCSEPFCHSDWLWCSVIWLSDVRWCLQTGVEDSGIVSVSWSQSVLLERSPPFLINHSSFWKLCLTHQIYTAVLSVKI